MKMNIKKLTLTAFLAAIAVAGSLFSFPVLGSRCSPIQHLVNVMCAVLLGIFGGAHPEYFGIGNPAGFSGKYVRGFIIKSAV